jgi:hypothetical protein
LDHYFGGRSHIGVFLVKRIKSRDINAVDYLCQQSEASVFSLCLSSFRPFVVRSSSIVTGTTTTIHRMRGFGLIFRHWLSLRIVRIQRRGAPRPKNA